MTTRYDSSRHDSGRSIEAKVFHILVLDDDVRIRQLLKRYLEEHGYRATAVADAAALEKELQRDSYELLVLDLVLPRDDGVSVCRRLRANNVDIPIIMLTAKGADHDRILGLEAGADDYLPKPFNPRELLARIQAVLRRVPRLPPSTPAADTLPVSFGPYTFDMAVRTLTRDGERVPLTSGDFALLKTLVTNPHRPLSRAALAKLARGSDHEPFDRHIDVRVSRLRKLMEADTNRPRYIQTVWGFGYVFIPEGEK